MGFEKLNTSNEAPGNKSQASFLKINKYEDPEMALGLISHICTSPKVIDIEPYFKRYNNLVEELKQDTNFEYSKFLNSDALDKLNRIRNYCTYCLKNNIGDTFEIVVAGGFSSGKSSMLNNILNIGKLLPTGIQPVSIVNTYMNCSSSNKNIIVQGENIQNNIVSLNTEVLDCIQHSSKSKVYIASVLNRLLINVPTNEQLNGITFIDTPGYNNSNNINVENQTSDKRTFLKALEDADAILWCIDIESGTISDSDFQILQLDEIKHIPTAIIFTKADKKGEQQHDSEIKKILEKAQNDILKKLGSDNHIIDIIAYSSAKNFSISLHDKTINDVIASLKNDTYTSNFDFCDNYIKDIFNEEIQESRKYLESLEEQRKEKSHEKNEYRKSRNSNSNNNGGIKNDLNEVFDNYDILHHIADKSLDLCNEAINRESEWQDKAGIFSNTTDLMDASLESIDDLNELINLYNSTISSYNRDYFFKALSNQDIPEDTTENDLEAEYDIIVDQQKEERQFLGILQRYNLSIPSAFKEAYQKANADVQKHFKSLQGITEHSGNDIFTAIRSGNYKDFLSCVSKGLDLTTCDREGYSPLTLAAKMGDNQIINFYLAHDVDLSLKDRNGYNILETAAIYHYQDICQLIINKDKSLFRQSRSLVELAKKNNFIQWISNIR